VPITVASYITLRPLYQGSKFRPLSILRQADRLQGRGEVNDLLTMELIAECLGMWPAFLMQESPWSPSLSTNYLPVAFHGFKEIGTSLEGNCNIELISFPTLAIRKASNQAAVLKKTPIQKGSV